MNWSFPGRSRSSLVFEPMERRHLRRVMPIETRAYPVSWSRSVFEGELSQVEGGHRYYVVARWGRQIVGYGGLWFVPDPDGDQAHITNIVVAEPYRGIGLGRCLLVHLGEVALERGCVAWTLEVRVSSEGAQALYRQFGFVPAGVRPRYYDGHEDAIVMWCHDLATSDYRERLTRLAGRGVALPARRRRVPGRGVGKQAHGVGQGVSYG